MRGLSSDKLRKLKLLLEQTVQNRQSFYSARKEVAQNVQKGLDIQRPRCASFNRQSLFESLQFLQQGNDLKSLKPRKASEDLGPCINKL